MLMIVMIITVIVVVIIIILVIEDCRKAADHAALPREICHEGLNTDRYL